MEIVDETEQARGPKGPAKNKNAKPPGPRGVHVSSLKKSKDGKEKEAASAVSNGTLAVDSHKRQPIKNKSFNDKQTRLSKVNFLLFRLTAYQMFTQAVKYSDRFSSLVSYYLFGFE